MVVVVVVVVLLLLLVVLVLVLVQPNRVVFTPQTRRVGLTLLSWLERVGKRSDSQRPVDSVVLFSSKRLLSLLVFYMYICFLICFFFPICCRAGVNAFSNPCPQQLDGAKV